MKISEKIINTSKNKYLDFLKSIILKDENFFPLRLRIKLPHPKNNYLEFYETMKEINSKSKESIKYGYLISFNPGIKTRDAGTQDIPNSVFFESEKDYLSFLNKEQEVNQFKKDFKLILTKYPELKSWIERFPIKIINSAGLWHDILKVCDYFYLNPKPNLYIRELPIQVHTKFIENNEAIIRELLDILISNEINSLEFDFKKRFNLKYDQFLIRVKVLDKNILLKNNLNNSFLDFSLPLDLFEKLNLNVDKVFIVENKMNFLTFPNIENSIIISGSGNGVNILKNSSWLNEKQIYYWGDIDSHGFAILSSFKKYFSNIKSLFMDFKTYDTFKEFEVKGEKTVQETFSNLTDEELKVFNYVHSNNLRLEQERISQEYIINNLKNE